MPGLRCLFADIRCDYLRAGTLCRICDIARYGAVGNYGIDHAELGKGVRERSSELRMVGKNDGTARLFYNLTLELALSIVAAGKTGLGRRARGYDKRNVYIDIRKKLRCVIT